MMIVGGRSDRAGREHVRERDVEHGRAVGRNIASSTTPVGEDVLSSSHDDIFTSEVMLCLFGC